MPPPILTMFLRLPVSHSLRSTPRLSLQMRGLSDCYLSSLSPYSAVGSGHTSLLVVVSGPSHETAQFHSRVLWESSHRDSRIHSTRRSHAVFSLRCSERFMLVHIRLQRICRLLRRAFYALLSRRRVAFRLHTSFLPIFTTDRTVHQ